MMFTHSCHFIQLNISTDSTNCSATEVLVNHMISFYANCAAVQTSNTFLARTSQSLFQLLKAEHVADSKSNSTVVKIPDNNKTWCIV